MRKSSLLAQLRARRGAAVAGGRRRGRARYGKRAPLRGFTALQSNSIIRAIKGKEETKYFATQLAQNQLIDAAIHTPGTDIMPLVPPIPQGTGEWQRVGRKVSPTKCRVDISATFGQLDLGTPTPDITPSQANAVYLVMYVLRSKTYKNWTEYLNATTPEYNFLLDDGQGNSVPFGSQTTPASGPSFWNTNTQYLQYPIETSHYTLIKKRVVKLVRNQGYLRSAVSGEAPNLNSSFYTGSFTYKLPKLIFDDTERGPTGAYPTNSNVMLAVGYAFADNLWAQDQNVGTSQAALPLVSITCRNHVWYKDA